MAIPENTSATSKKSRHDKLAAIIRDRLELDAEWSAATERPKFFDEIEKSRLSEFEDAFGQMVRAGCKWEVLLTCLARYRTYNTRERIEQPARYDSDEELPQLSKPPVKGHSPIGRPPDRDRRKSIVSNLDAAIGIIKNHESLLCELGQFEPPPGIVDYRLTAHQLTADEVVLNLTKLLTWCRKLLSEDSLGNFRTVESVGRLVPCVYIDVVTPKRNSIRDRRLPLRPIAKLLSAMSNDDRFTQGQLREALARFKRQYPSVYRQLRAKIEVLHCTSNEPPDGWRQLFAAEARRRSR